MARQPAGLTFEMKRTLPAGRSVVFDGFTEPSALARWWGPDGFTIPDVDFEPRVGSTFRIVMQPPEGDAFRLTGTFREVDPPKSLAFTFSWDPPDPDDVETLARVSFTDRGGSTELAVTQGPFKTEARRDLHRDGWRQSLDKLELLLAARGPDEHELKRRLASGTAKYLVNPVVRGLFRLGLPAPGIAILETTGRKSGEPRRNPVTNGLDDGVFWIVSEHGRRAGYVRNIEANPRVRVRVGRRWLGGMAWIVPDDDPRERLRHIRSRRPITRLSATTVSVLQTDLLTVRVDLDGGTS